MSSELDNKDPVVITGIGMLTSLGHDRETVWRNVREGHSGVRWLTGVPGIPDGQLLAATLDIDGEIPRQLKQISLCKAAAAEAVTDAAIDFSEVDLDRFGCAISGHIGDTGWIDDAAFGIHRGPYEPVWWEQFLPNASCSEVANRYRLCGPRFSHSVACASGLIDFLSAVRAVHDNQCDIALAGSAEAIHPLFAAGFQRMRVLAHDDDPQRACRPFDIDRKGFVMGEGAAMFVVERLSHARRRGARIYAEVLAGKHLAQAHHVTGLDAESEALTYLIRRTLEKSGISPGDVGYINVHGTGTKQNDLVESVSIRRAFGPQASKTCASATKSMLGHLVNASGSVELAVTTLAMRDGFVPPTLNLTNPDPECDIDCIPLVGRRNQFEHALKLSVAFGGHLVAVALRRWPEVQSQLEPLPELAAVA